ncbi:unnamed protein product [Closterium sp. NIES-65]|nr:unnamed protein product [Closterium sp. NIES-65]
MPRFNEFILLPPSRRSRSIQPYPLPHYPLTPLQPTSQSLRPIHPAISSPLPPGRRLPPPRRRLPSPRRRLSSSPPSHLPPPSPLPPPRRRLPPPRRRLSSSPPSPLLLPAVASPPSRPSLSSSRRRPSPSRPFPPPPGRLSLLPAVASRSSPRSPLPTPRRRLSFPLRRPATGARAQARVGTRARIVLSGTVVIRCVPGPSVLPSPF